MRIVIERYKPNEWYVCIYNDGKLTNYSGSTFSQITQLLEHNDDILDVRVEDTKHKALECNEGAK